MTYSIETNPPEPDFIVPQSEEIPSWPEDTILKDYVDFACRYSEAPVDALLGVILSVCAGILARRVWVDFAGPKYPNLYALLAAIAGMRKSTTIGLARTIAWKILRENRFTSSIASEEALFSEYNEEDGGDPDKMLIVDEGNTVMSNWMNTSYGKVVAKRYLNLYDCGRFQVSFQKNRGGGSGVMKCIPETSTNILMGATLNVANFQGLESADGMRRRFIVYLCEDFERTIYFPASLNSPEFDTLVHGFSELHRGPAGEIGWTDCGVKAFMEIQDRNRQMLRDLPATAADVEGSILAEQVSIVLKMATIFQCLRAISPNSPISTGTKIQLDADILRIAEAHSLNRLNDARRLQNVSRREQIRKDAEDVYATVMCDFTDKADESGRITLTQTELTRKFARNPGRPSSLRDSLYSELIPSLKSEYKCVELDTYGKGRRFQFIPEEC